MWLYAQIDEAGVIVSMSQLAGEVDNSALIPLTKEEFGTYGLGWRYVDGAWLPPLPEVGVFPGTAEILSAQSLFSVMELGVDVPVARISESSEVLARAAKLEAPHDMELWDVGKWYPAGVIVRFDEVNYAAVQGHFSQDGWEPDVVPALWAAVRGEYAEWVRPMGAHDAYRLGDRFVFEGNVWEVVLDFMVFSPAEFAEGFKKLKGGVFNEE
jgi:hypothetical protein